MNDSLFASYDSLFCPSIIQSSELQHNANQQRLADHDLQQTALYYNGGQNDSSHATASSHHQTNISANSTGSNVCRNETNLIAAALNNANNNATGFNGTHNNIPFVQIHTTDVQPQRNNYGNVFRRPAASVAEIKSEPIKSETADNSKDRVNGTPTPPVRGAERVTTPASNQNGEPINENETSTVPVTVGEPSNTTALLDISKAYQTVRKCSHCRFLCLNEEVLGKHMLTVHDTTNLYHNVNNNRPANKQIPCPGCSNMFFSLKSLEIHLIEDHTASLEDVKQIIETVTNIDTTTTCTPDDGGEKTNEPFTQQRKSRIYLKNVECLREPRRHEQMTLDGPPPPAPLNHVSDGFFSMNSFNNLERSVELNDILNTDFADITAQMHQDKQLANDVHTTTVPGTSGLVNSKPKQKISIKSVDVLREPGLLRREYELQNQFGNMPNVCNDNVCFETYGSYPIQSINEVSGMGGGNESNGFNIGVPATENICNNDSNNMERQRRPKIYIKNVDILKEPIILPPFVTGNTMGLQDPNQGMNYNFLAQSMQQTPTNTDFLNTINNLNVSNQVFDNELPMGGTNISDAYLFENANANGSSNKGSNLLGDIAGLNPTESFQGYGNVSGGANVNVNPNFLSYPLINCSNMESTSTTPIMTEPTPPPVFNLQSVENALLDSTESTPTSTPTPTPPQQKQKIFIKNVDILKEPQFQEQRERGTLHLRTVDELNLMNRNEVESLIAPNLENNNGNHCGNTTLRDNFNNSDDLTVLPEDEEMLYEDETRKLQDFATQLVNSWSSEDYDLSEGIGGIITDSIEHISNLPAAIQSLSPSDGSQSNSMPKILHDLETPQMSMISLRGIEELTVPQQQPTLTCLEQSNSNQTHCELSLLDSHAVRHDLCTNSMEAEIAKPCVTCADSITAERDKSQQELIQTNVSSTMTIPLTATVITPNSTTTTTIPMATSTASFTFNLPLEMPPLTPMTNFSQNNRNISREGMSSGSVAVVTVASTIPMPPLVPVSTLAPFPVSTVTSKSNGQMIVSTAAQPNVGSIANTATTTATSSTTTTTTTPPTERGRIYVANNLMQVPPPSKRDVGPQKATANTLSVTGGTSVRGRPFGSNRADNTVKLNKARPEAGEVVIKCSLRGCAFRFKKPETLAYHNRCHDKNSSSLQAKICPECKSTDFSNWNTLHTHLWRSHQIDMELYSCSQCPFKTPIYSRLINTHTKIHSEERNYKCDQCGKAFKNTKQLKNHRRWHRTHSNATNSAGASSNGTTDGSTASDAIPADVATTTTTATTATVSVSMTPAEAHRCSDCGSAFSHLKTLREHSCKKSHHQLQCSVCGHAASSKSSLKLHMFTHENSKRLKCGSCTYSTSDHNAFRRHKMTHENTKMYTCPHCTYKSIQSVTFQKHVLLKHPDAASTLIHKCKQCSYSTVNRQLFAVHQIKHKSAQSEILLKDVDRSDSSVELIEIDVASQAPDNNSPLDDSAYLNNKSVKSSANQKKPTSTTISCQPKTIKVKSDLLIKDKAPRVSAQFISIDTDESKLKTGTNTILNGITI